MTPINPNMLILARQSRGYTQQQLANLIDIDQGNLSKMEQGLLNIPPKLISKVTQCLSYPSAFFYEPGQIYNGISYHRKRKSLSKKHLDKIDAIINIRKIHLQKLLNSVEIKMIDFPFVDIENSDKTPEMIAQDLRQYWKVPKGPIENLTRLIENFGGVIIEIDFETMQVDGFGILFNELPPVIFINKTIPGDRIRFTLAHELGHIVMHSFPTETMEVEANHFANEFLMPTNEIKPFLTNLSLPKLADLKRYWKVSMAAIIEKAYHLNQITERKRRFLYTQMGKAGYRRKEPIEIPREQTSLVKELIDTHLTDLNYTVQDLSRLLLLNENELMAIYQIYGNMRLVK